LRDYLDNVFIKIVDIWGFISIYLPIIEILFNNYSNLQENELKIFNKLKYIFVYYLYNPRHEPINIDNLFSELNKLQNLILVVVNQKTKIQNYSARGIYNKKTIKNKLNIKSTKNISFKRKPKQRRFKNPFLLSLK
jgi:hypothetical protein